MVVAIAALAAVGLVCADAAGVTLLRSYLMNRVDAQLTAPRRGNPGEATGRVRGFPSFGPQSRYYRYRADGTRDYTADVSEPTGPELGSYKEIAAHAATGRPYTVDGPDGPWRVYVTAPAAGGYNVSAVSLREIAGTEDSLLLIDIVVTGIVLLLIGVAAASVVRLGLRPLTRMEETAAEIAGGNLSRRVTDADPHTESGRLGTAVNTMLVRIEAAIADREASERRLRQFLADASHELRTPLTSIQGFAELYRRGGTRPGPELDEAMARIEAEVGRMRVLVNDLLVLARLDEERPIERRPVDLLAVAADAVRDAHVRVPTRFVRLSDLDDGGVFEPVTVLGDEARIRQVATNLVANALQHTPDDAAVEVRVGRDGRLNRMNGTPPAAAVGVPPPTDRPIAVLEVVDTGPGMPAVDAERAFERLYRADPSRSRQHGGAGLGLAIAAAIVQAHSGRIELWTAPGDGARFRVLLPAEPPLDAGFPAISEDL
jgi:two-component system OmpR family sensor kinase